MCGQRNLPAPLSNGIAVRLFTARRQRATLHLHLEGQMKNALFCVVALLALLCPRSSKAIEGGWWWNPAESGRGFSIEVQGNTVFLAGYLYGQDGHATWVAASGAMSDGNQRCVLGNV